MVVPRRDGSYEITGLEPGRYRVRLASAKHGAATIREKEITLAGDGATGTVDFEISGSVIEGSVMDGDLEPVIATVMVVDEKSMETDLPHAWPLRVNSTSASAPGPLRGLGQCGPPP